MKGADTTEEKVLYYPGCSLHSTAREYDLSARAVCDTLGITLVESPDWNCCGATSAHSLNHRLGLALPARNLVLAEQAGLDMMTACAACFNRLKGTDRALAEDADLREEVKEILGVRNIGRVRVRHLIEVLSELPAEVIRRRVVRPLSDLHPVCYYGCLLVRPPDAMAFDDPEHPRMLDRLLRAAGATPVDWSYRTECCGASLSLTRRDIVERLVGRLVAMAREAGARCMVTACPLCQINLDTRQSGEEPMPVFYFTEVLGWAFGLEDGEDWLRRHMVDPRPALEQ